MTNKSLSYCLIAFYFLVNVACSKEDVLTCQEEQVPKAVIPPLIDDEEEDSSCIYTSSNIFVGAEKYMDLTNWSGWAQASANYGDFLFQGYENNLMIDVYNLKTKTFIGRIPIDRSQQSSLYHVNTINFGNQFYAEDDAFPVLYVCSGYRQENSTKSLVFAYRIVQADNDVFRAELIQTITLDFGSWTEAILDNEHNAIWIRDKHAYRKYPVPSVFDGDCLISSRDNCLKEITLFKRPFASSDQGHLFYDDRIWFASGVPGWSEKTALYILNTLTDKCDMIELKDLGLVNPLNPLDNTFEPEGVIAYNNQIMICFRKAIYYLISKGD
jgi:hypothetical protein